jgi:hypothetical protein
VLFGSDVGSALTADEADFLRDFAPTGAISHDPVSRGGAKAPDPEPEPDTSDPDYDASTGTYLPIDPLLPTVKLPVVKPKATAKPGADVGKLAIAAGALVGIAVAVYFVGRTL